MKVYIWRHYKTSILSAISCDIWCCCTRIEVFAVLDRLLILSAHTIAFGISLSVVLYNISHCRQQQSRAHQGAISLPGMRLDTKSSNLGWRRACVDPPDWPPVLHDFWWWQLHLWIWWEKDMHGCTGFLPLLHIWEGGMAGRVPTNGIRQ